MYLSMKKVVLNIYLFFPFIAGAYNMGGSPTFTVEKIKNMVYMNQTGEPKTPSREEFLGEFIFNLLCRFLLLYRFSPFNLTAVVWLPPL